MGSALGQAQNKSENPSSTQNRGLKRGISKEFGQVLQSAGIDAATSDIRRLPTTDIYAVGGGCQIPAYFKVINGHASPEAAPQGFEEAEGMRCGDSPTFVGSVDGTPVVFQQHYDWGSAMDAQVLVATWRGDRLAGTCQVTLSYAPLFWTKTFNDWGERCNSAACEEFRAAAFKLVEAVQNSPRHALAAQLASLSRRNV